MTFFRVTNTLKYFYDQTFGGVADSITEKKFKKTENKWLGDKEWNEKMNKFSEKKAEKAENGWEGDKEWDGKMYDATQPISNIFNGFYDMSHFIAPNSQAVMNFFKQVSPNYKAILNVTQKGGFPKLFDVFGFTSEKNGKNITYHANQSGSLQSWKYTGFNSLYDGVFNCATNMDKARFEFSHQGKDYTLWTWKGDYLNLGAGAEMGIYTRMVVDGIPTSHWIIDQNLSMPMTLKLKYKGITIDNYTPNKKKWWITSFNPNYQNVQESDLTATFTVDFSDNKGMFNAFYNKYKDKAQLQLDTENFWLFDTINYKATYVFK